MNDEPGIGELGRGLNDLKADVRALSVKVDGLPAAFVEHAISRERYEADEARRKIEHDALQKQVDDIDDWKQGATLRNVAIIGGAAAFATAVATIIQAIH